MATVPTMDTWTAGEMPTAAKFNKNIRDAGNFFRARPVASATRSTTQSIPDNSYTDIVFDTSLADNDGMYTTTGFVVVTPGIYLVTAQFSFTGNATGQRVVRISKGATDIANIGGPANGGSFVGQNVTYIGPFVAGDTIKMAVYQNSGAALTTATGGRAPQFTALWVAA